MSRGRPSAGCVFDRGRRKAKQPGMLLHDLRRTAVRSLIRAGVPQIVAMKLTGRKTTAVFHRYAITDTTLLREGVAKLARLNQASEEAC